MNKKQIISYVETCISKLKADFEKNHNIFIDGIEDDIRSYLYHLIGQNKLFLEHKIEYELDNGKKIVTKLMHSEAKTYEKINKRKGRFDIGIINPSQDTDENDYLVGIELKWIAKLSQKSINRIKEDIDKINKEGNQVENGYLLIFNDKIKYTKNFMDKVNSYNKNKEKLKIIFINSNNVLS